MPVTLLACCLYSLGRRGARRPHSKGGLRSLIGRTPLLESE